MNYLAAYAASLVALLALDAVWLKLVAIDWYKRDLSHLMAPQMNLVAGAVFYLLFPAAIVFFAVVSTASSGWPRTAVVGALLGLTAYATYDLTNLATLKDWPVSMALADMAWGSVVTAAAALAGRAAWLAVVR
jgi:uncharacterized membrane protein